MKTLLTTIALLACVALAAHPGHVAQATEPPPMTNAYKAQIVRAAADSIEASYIFPDTGETIAKQLRKNLRKGEYDEISDPAQLAEALREDIIELSKDKHFNVFYHPQRVEMLRAQASATEEEQQKAREMDLEATRKHNFGFREVKLLEGNVGYLRFDEFSGLPEAYPVATAAMNFLSNADALIIDLRWNGGGYATMIQFITTYLFSPYENQVHLNSFEERGEELVKQSWTLPYVPGGSLADVPVYVLTSSYTFSGAEEFSYNLQNLERGTIVGETTNGGAHPVSFMILDDWFVVKIPTGRAINPVTHTNWEGVGVTPDVEVPQEEALAKAHELCLRELMNSAADPRELNLLDWALATIAMQRGGYSVPTENLDDYVGVYGPREIRREGDRLQYKRTGPWEPLSPISEDLFGIEGVDYFRVRFDRNGQGEVTTLVGLYDNGAVEPSPRSN